MLCECYLRIKLWFIFRADVTAGVFLHNAAEQWIDVSYSKNPTTHFMAEGGTLDLFVLLGPTPKDVVRQFTNLTGKAVLPQVFSVLIF